MSSANMVPLADNTFIEGLFESLPGVICIVDQSGRFVRWNAGFQRLLGLGDAEIWQLVVSDLVVPRDRERVAQLLEISFATGEEVTFECSIRVGDREVPFCCCGVSVKTDGAPYLIGMAFDLTSRVATETALGESERKYREIFNATNDAMVIHAPDGRLLDVNAQWCSMFGYSREEVLDTSISPFVFLPSPYSEADAHEKVRRAVQEGPQVFEWPCKSAKGSEIWAEVALRATVLQGQQVVIAAVRDVSERKSAEAALRASEERFRRLFDSAADPILIHDESGHIVDVNRATCNSLLYSRDELLNMSIEDVETSVDADTLKRMWDSARAGNDITVEGVHRRKDGMSFPVDIHVSPIQFGDRALLYASARDISERKNAEAALRENERRLALAVSATADGIWEWDLQSGRTYYSPRWYEILGYTDRQLPMSIETWRDLLHPDDLKGVLDRIRSMLEDSSRQSCEAEFRMRAASGTWIWILGRGAVVTRDAAGKPKALAGTNTDVTERREAEREVAEWKRRYDVLARAAGHIVYDCDTEGQVVWSDAITLRLGYEPEELQGGFAQWAERVHPDDRERAVRRYESATTTGTVFMSEYRFRHRNGEYVWIEDIAYPMFDDHGRLQRYVGLMADITERRRAEADRVRLEESLRHAQKMESIGRLAGGIAHDFNNLLTAISGNLSLAMLGDAGDGSNEDVLFEAARAAESAANLTRQLLTFSRKQVIHPKVLCLNDTVFGLQKMLRRLLGEDIELCVRLAPKLGQVETDEGQFEQIVVNLAVNARDAMPDGGKLIVETANVSADESICRSNRPLKPGEYVRISVSDSGTGMSPQVLEHLFEPFFTTKEVGKGTGLGLAMVYGAVQQNRGHITIESQLGRGTAVHIFLPRVDNVEKLRGLRPSDPPPSGIESIFVVEDEVQVRSLAVRILERQGYRVHAYGNGEDALLALTQTHEPVDLLLTDVVMPGMNGKVLAERAREVRPGLRVLFTSGYNEDVIMHHGILEQRIEFIAKPYSVESLTRRVREVLDSKDSAVEARYEQP